MNSTVARPTGPLLSSSRALASLAAFLFFAFASTAAAQGFAPQRPEFFQSTPIAAPAANAPGVKSRATPVRFNAAEMLALKPLDEVEITLPNQVTHAVVFDLMTRHGEGIASWVGRLKDRGNHYRVIITSGPGGSFGVIDTPDGSYRIVPGDRHDWLVDMTEEQLHIPVTMPQNDMLVDPAMRKSLSIDLSTAHFETAIPGVNTVGMSKAAPTPQAVIDMMFVVTRGLANRLGINLATRLNFLVTRANTSYADSDIAMTLRLVNFTVIDFADNTTDSAALDAITPGRAQFNAATFGNIETIRTLHGADMVSLLRDGSSFGGSGVAWVPAPSSASFMYSTMRGCVLGCESVWIHEVGHNMGNSHDRATSAWEDGGGLGYDSIPPSAAFGYAFCKSASGLLTCNPFITNGTPGACVSGTQPECSSNDASNFSDIMAYFHGTTDRIYKFSNVSPTVACVSTRSGADGIARPCGVAAGSPNPADTASTMNSARATISALKTTVAVNLPGALQFTATGYSGTETGGTMTFNVTRVNGTGGAVSVAYAVTGNSATAGTDFTAASGVLNWADGDSGSKPFTVTLTNDALVEGIETLTATLSSPAGAPGVYLGFPSSAVGLILEDWGGTAGGALPGGFVSSDPIAALLWTVANDQAYEGTTSLRSGRDYGDLTNYKNSDLTYTGNIPAGTIAFAYRVSSYQGYGVFEFSVDGTTVLSDTGETGWKLYSYSLAAGGNHTLRWRFKNRLSSACNSGWNPPPEGGSNCADRVWVDAVSLPVSLAASTTTLASSPNPSSVGQSVTFTASVSGSAGTAAGTVAFRNAATTITACSAQTLSSGSATCSVSALAAGSHSITAVYSGSASYATSTSSVLTQVVSSGTLLLSASPATLDFGGQSMNTTAPALTTTITNTSASGVTVTGVTAPTGYAVASNNCTTLAAAATCQISIVFTPGSEGTLAGVLSIAYAGGGPTAVALAGVGERSLVTHYYRSILRRAPDAPGKAFWLAEAARVQGLQASINEVWYSMAMSFYFSPEYALLNRDNNGFLTDLYNTFFNRAPDTGGFNFWLSQLSSGMPREGVLANFMFSPEFANFTQAIFGNTAARGEINVVVDFYRGLLSRLPDSGGFNFYVGQFRIAQCQGAGQVYTQVENISSGYANSQEYSNRGRSTGQYVADLYNAFLRRGPDLGGIQFWIGQITTGARTREAVRQEFKVSPEFNLRVNAVLAETCIP